MSHIVKVKYLSSTGEVNGREYTYFSEDPLKIGDVVTVPVRDTTGKALVSSIDVSEAEIATYREKVKTIPSGSVLPPANEDQASLADAAREAGAIVTEAKVAFSAIALPVATIKIEPASDPSVIALSNEAQGLLRYAQGRSIISDDSARLATDDLNLMAKLKKGLEDKRKEYVTPIRKYLDAVNEAFKTITAPLEEADRITRGKILSYRQEQERKRREAEAINREKAELAKREAALNETGEITVDTTPVVVPPAPVARVVTETGTVGTMKVRKYRVLDFAKLPDEYKIENSSLLTKVVKAGIPSIAGVEIFEEETLRVSAK